MGQTWNVGGYNGAVVRCIGDVPLPAARNIQRRERKKQTVTDTASRHCKMWSTEENLDAVLVDEVMQKNVTAELEHTWCVIFPISSYLDISVATGRHLQYWIPAAGLR